MCVRGMGVGNWIHASVRACVRACVLVQDMSWNLKHTRHPYLTRVWVIDTIFIVDM